MVVVKIRKWYVCVCMGGIVLSQYQSQLVPIVLSQYQPTFC